MAIYRSVQTTFWTDTKITDDFTPEDKYFYLYLFTNPHTNLCGCYEISKKQAAVETGYSAETIERLIDRFEHFHNVVRYDPATKEVLLINWHKYNWTKSPKFRKPVGVEIAEIKNTEFKRFLTELLNNLDTVSIPYPYPMDTTVSNTNTVTNTVDSNTNNKSNSKERNKERKFIPPTLEEVNAYISEKNLNVDGKAFLEYFSETNWIDSKGNKVKSWKGKLLVWNNFESKKAPAKKQPYMESSGLKDDLAMLEELAIKGGKA